MKIIYLFLLFVIISCISNKNEIEYIGFQHECPILRKSDKILIKIIPSSKKHNKDKIVQLTYHGKSFMRKPLTNEEYQKIVNSIMQLNNEKIKTNKEINERGEKPVIITPTDVGYITIEYRKGNIFKSNTSHISDLKNNKELYNIVMLITKAAGLDIENIH